MGVLSRGQLWQIGCNANAVKELGCGSDVTWIDLAIHRLIHVARGDQSFFLGFLTICRRAGVNIRCSDVSLIQ